MVILRSRRARRPARALVIAAGGLLAAVPAAGQGQAGSESASALAQGLTAGGGAAGDGVLGLELEVGLISGGAEAASPGYRLQGCLLYTSPSPRDLSTSRMPSSA